MNNEDVKVLQSLKTGEFAKKQFASAAVKSFSNGEVKNYDAEKALNIVRTAENSDFAMARQKAAEQRA